MKQSRVIPWLVIFLLTGPGTIPGGELRKPTGREIDFHNQLVAAIEKALPGGPLGWQLEERIGAAAPELVAADAAWRPFIVHYEVVWADPQRKKLAALDEKRSIEKLEKAEEERALEEVEQKLRVLESEREDALQGRDMAAAQGLDREIENLRVQLDKKNSWPGEEEEQMRKRLKNEGMRGTTLRISLDINLFALNWGELVPERITLPVQAGSYRCPGGFSSEGEWQEGATMVLLGRNWRLSGDSPARWQADEPVGLPSTRTYSLVVRAQGDSSRTRQYHESIDWMILDGLIFK